MGDQPLINCAQRNGLKTSRICRGKTWKGPPLTMPRAPSFWRRSSGCTTVEVGQSDKTQQGHCTGGAPKRWLCLQQGNVFRHHVLLAPWMELGASSSSSGTMWRRSTSGRKPSATTCMTPTKGTHIHRAIPASTPPEHTAVLSYAIADAASWWAVRTGKASLAVPRMPAFTSAGRREHWLQIDPRALREWAMAAMAVTLGLTAALQAERPGLPVRASLQDELLSRDTLPEHTVYVGRGSSHHRLQVTKWRSPWTPGAVHLACAHIRPLEAPRAARQDLGL